MGVTEKVDMRFTAEEMCYIRDALRQHCQNEYGAVNDRSELVALVKLYDRIHKTIDVYFPDFVE